MNSKMAVLYGNDALSILALSTKKRFSSDLEKGFRFPENLFQVRVLETFKVSTDCHIKTCRSLKRRAFLKIHIIAF